MSTWVLIIIAHLVDGTAMTKVEGITSKSNCLEQVRVVAEENRQAPIPSYYTAFCVEQKK